MVHTYNGTASSSEYIVSIDSMTIDESLKECGNSVA
jgi:hypothetical protein